MSRRPLRLRQKALDSLLRPQAAAPDSLRATMASFLEGLAVRHYSEPTRVLRAHGLLRFVRWCEERGLVRPTEVTRPLLERYQRHLFYARKPNGHVLSARTQHSLLGTLRQYFKYLARQGLLPANPASELLLPRLATRIPRHVLSPGDVEKVLRLPDVSTVQGLRDRALLEVLWATGVRRGEVARLSVFDFNAEAGTVFVHQGKGAKDRVVPVGPRAIEWVRRYLEESRPRLLMPPDEGILFLSNAGLPVTLNVLSHLVADYVRLAGVSARGSCHLFRHACATQMLEGGADIRFVQELLGHAKLDTTEVYTRVSISKLKAVYAATHPAAKAKLLAQLAAEGDEEAAHE